jgi:hypothetical protein
MARLECGKAARQLRVVRLDVGMQGRHPVRGLVYDGRCAVECLFRTCQLLKFPQKTLFPPPNVFNSKRKNKKKEKEATMDVENCKGRDTYVE